MTGDRDLARRLCEGLSAGRLPDDLFTEDATVWTTSSGANPVSRYLAGVPMLATCFAQPPRYVVDAITAEDDRVVAEAHADGTLIDGQAYAMTYVFVLRVRDGRIAALAEHMNPIVVRERIAPLLAEVMKSRKG